MVGFLKQLRLSARIALLGTGSALATAAALLWLATWQSSQYNILSQREVDSLIDADLDHITQGVYNLVYTENEAVQQQVNDNLRVALHVLATAGKVSLANETILWKAVNQFTNRPMEIRLPKMLVGGRWLGSNDNPAKGLLPNLQGIASMNAAIELGVSIQDKGEDNEKTAFGCRVDGCRNRLDRGLEPFSRAQRERRFERNRIAGGIWPGEKYRLAERSAVWTIFTDPYVRPHSCHRKRRAKADHPMS